MKNFKLMIFTLTLFLMASPGITTTTPMEIIRIKYLTNTSIIFILMQTPVHCTMN